MLSLGSARAAFLLYQNARAATGAVDHLTRYLVPLLRDFSATDAPLARQLELLSSRADSVCPALDFLLEWCSDKGSSLQNILFHARDTLHRIERFLASLGSGVSVPSVLGMPLKARIGGGSISSLSEAEKEAIMKQIDGHLRELDFAMHSLSLAVAVVNASSVARPLLPSGATYAATGPSSVPSAELPRYISPSCLLRASERMRSMAGGSGDLVVSYGSFYKQTVIRGRSFGDTIRKAMDAPSSLPAEHPQQQVRWTVPMCPVSDIHTSSSSATVEQDSLDDERPLAIAINSAGGRMLVHREGGSPQARWVESGAEPEMQMEQEVDEWNDLGQAAMRGPSPSSQTIRPVIAATPSPQPSPRIVPTNSAASAASTAPTSSPSLDSESVGGLSPWRQLYSSASLKIVRNAARNMYELHVSDVSLSSRDHLSRPSSSTLKLDLSASLAFRSTSSVLLGLREDAAAKQGLSADIDAVFAFEDCIANTLQARYAFMIHAVSGSADSSSDLPAGAAGAVGSINAASTTDRDSVSPLDIAYLARLCTYENMHNEHTRSSLLQMQRRSVNLGAAANSPALAHTMASDEELWLLLAGVHLQSEAVARSAPASGRTASAPVAVTAASSLRHPGDSD